MKISLKYIVLILFSVFEVQSYGQLELGDVKMNQIRQKKIRKYIECQISEGKHLFSEIHPSWSCEKDLSFYKKNEMSFFLNGNIQDIWQSYVSANPSKSWNGRRISFGLLIKKSPDNIFYNNDSIAGVDTGQVYFLNLKLILGFCNIPVAFEIIKVDPEEKTIEFSYIEGNKSAGVQRIKFVDEANDRIKIIHISYFKSNSGFRDKCLYPFFHKKLVNDFHANMRLLMEDKV